MIIHARTKKKRHRGYTARAVRCSGRPVPLKKLTDAEVSGYLNEDMLTPNTPCPASERNWHSHKEVVQEKSNN